MNYRDLQRMVNSWKMSYQEWPNPGRWLTVNSQIPEDDLPKMAKSWKMSYQEWPNPGRWLTKIGQIPACDKPESQKRIWWNQQPKGIFWEWAIPACRKPELIGILKLTSRGLKNAGKSLWLDKAIPETFQPQWNSFIFLSWDCIIKILKKLGGPQVYYSGSNEPIVSPPKFGPDKPLSSAMQPSV